MSAATSVMTHPAQTTASKRSTKAWSTPRILKTFRFLIWAGAALLLIVGETTLNEARTTMDRIARGTAPSIMAAQEIHAHLADLDTNLANYLLTTGDAAQQAMKVFEYRYGSAIKRLVDASQNITEAITGADSEKIPIVMILANLGRYLELASQIRYLHEHPDPQRPLAAIDTYRVATDLMHARILPDADALDAVNEKAMEDAYASRAKATLLSEVVVVVVGAGLALALLIAQRFVFRRMRRIVNVPLLIAMGLTVAFSAYLVYRFGAAKADLKTAKIDAFDSIHVLWQIRATAYDANGDESRYLLEKDSKDRQAKWTKVFDDRVASLTPQPRFPATMQAAVRSAPATKIPGEDKQLFVKEANNVTFRGEKEAATAMLSTFADYYDVDRKLREKEGMNDHAAAVALCLNESNAAFDRFDAAVLHTIVINKDAFDAVVADSDKGLKLAEIVDPILALAIALLGWLGIRPRLREYAA